MDAQKPSRFRFIAFRFAQAAFNQLTFYLQEKLVQLHPLFHGPRTNPMGQRQSLRQILNLDEWAIGLQANLLDDFGKFVQIALPRIKREDIQRVIRETAELFAAAGVELLEKMLGEQRNVIRAVRQRRK